MMMSQDHDNQIREQEITRQVQNVHNRHPKSQILNTAQNHELPRDDPNLEHINKADQLENQQQDKINEAKEDPELLQSEIQDGKKLGKPTTKDQDREEHLHKSQGHLDDYAATQSLTPMPSDDMMRHSIADNLMEILVNMTNPHYRRECLELLKASDPLQARSEILNILQRIDMERSSSSQQ